MSTYAVAGLAFLAAALATVSLVLGLQWWQDRRRNTEAREQLRRLAMAPTDDPATADVLRAAASGDLAARLAQLPVIGGLQTLVDQARLGGTVESLLIGCLGTGVAVALFLLLVLRSPVAALVGGAAAAALPIVRLARARNRLRTAFEVQLPETIDLMSRAVRAGHPISAGFKMVADESPEPTQTEFRRIFEEQRFGMPIDDSLLGLADRMPLVDVRILVAAVLIQREVGGNLAEILDNLAHVIRERFMIRRQILTFTAQGRMTGYLLGALPIALFSLLFLVNRSFMLPMLEQPLGRAMLGMAVLMQIAGFFWIRRIVDIDI